MNLHSKLLEIQEGLIRVKPSDLVFKQVSTRWNNKVKRRGRYIFSLTLQFYNREDELKKIVTNLIFEPDKNNFFIHHMINPEGDFEYLLNNGLGERNGQQQNGFRITNPEAFDQRKFEYLNTRILQLLSKDNFSLWRIREDREPRPYQRISSFGRMHFVLEEYL